MSLKKTKDDDLDLGKGSPRGECSVQGVQVGPVTGPEPCVSAPNQPSQKLLSSGFWSYAFSR